MATIDEDLRTLILSDSDVSTAVGGERVHYQHVPEGIDDDYIFFRRAGSDDEDARALSDASGSKYQFRELFDVEAISTSLGDSTDLALLLKKFNNHQNTIGAGSCQAVFVRDHADDYIPAGTLGDDGRFVGALQFEVIGYQEG